MGKPRKREKKPRHRKALGDQLEDPTSHGVRTRPRAQKRKRGGDDEQEDEPLSAALSGRILKAAREQQEELDLEDTDLTQGKSKEERSVLAAAVRGLAEDDYEDEDGDDAVDDADLPNWDGISLYTTGEAEEKISPDDERALAAFMAPEGAASRQQQSLADIVLAKLREKQEEQGLSVMPQEGEAPVPEGLDEKVVAVYRGVGKLLSRFTTGKMPKAFKIIPNLKNWEEVLYLTNPDGWSPHATYEATKIFVSSLNAALAQRFLALVLLPRIRREITEKQKLHVALFMAVKKATYKPGAFYKGIILPLCASRTCTLREAVTLTSVLRRTSLPVMHSAAALLRLADMEYCGTTSFFMRVLLDKKYALPYRVIDALVRHFLRFADDERAMPVVWHQTLLAFVQRYKHVIRDQDKAALRSLCSAQHHYQVTPEVLRELDHSRGRGERDGGAVAMEVVAVIGAKVAEDPRKMPPVPLMDFE